MTLGTSDVQFLWNAFRVSQQHVWGEDKWLPLTLTDEGVRIGEIPGQDAIITILRLDFRGLIGLASESPSLPQFEEVRI